MTTRPALLMAMLLATTPATSAAAQARPAAPQATEQAAGPASAPAPAAVDEHTARDIRQRLNEILDQYPPSVGQVLRLDPSLLTKADYLAPYPKLAAYLSQHPEVAHNPGFFLGARTGGPQYFETRPSAANAIENVFVGLEVLLGVVCGIFAVAWLLRSAIDHRRWLRATKIQTDAHNKIVDRLSSNDDLLAYMQSPTGQRFLTASFGLPAVVDAAPQIVGAPFNRILWSVQAGIVLAAAGVGLWFAKNGAMEEIAQTLQVISTLTIALGV